MAYINYWNWVLVLSSLVEQYYALTMLVAFKKTVARIEDFNSRNACFIEFFVSTVHKTTEEKYN